MALTMIIQEGNYEFYNQACCNQYTGIPWDIEAEFPSWSLLMLGTGDAYDQSMGLSQARFKMRYKFLHPYELEPPPLESPKLLSQKAINLDGEEEFPSLLSAAAIPVKSTPDRTERTLYKPPSEDYSRYDQYGNKHRGSRDRNRRQSNNQSPLSNLSEHRSRGGWIGYEYECPLGHRFILPFSTLIGYSKLSSYNSQVSVNGFLQIVNWF